MSKLVEKKVGKPGGPESKRKKIVPKAATKPRARRSADIGRALRSVYDETLREDVPDDFTDLLGKLR
jgi:hypothetical protein